MLETVLAACALLRANSELFKILLSIAIVLAILFLAWIIETFRFRRIAFPTAQQRLDRRRRCIWGWIICAITMAILTFGLMMSGADARV
jgi:hypothetical protein